MASSTFFMRLGLAFLRCNSLKILPDCSYGALMVARLSGIYTVQAYIFEFAERFVLTRF